MGQKIEHTAISVISNDSAFWKAFIRWMNSYPAAETNAEVTIVAHSGVPEFLEPYCTPKTDDNCGQVQLVQEVDREDW